MCVHERVYTTSLNTVYTLILDAHHEKIVTFEKRFASREKYYRNCYM